MQLTRPSVFIFYFFNVFMCISTKLYGSQAVKNVLIGFDFPPYKYLSNSFANINCGTLSALHDYILDFLECCRFYNLFLLITLIIWQCIAINAVRMTFIADGLSCKCILNA